MAIRLLKISAVIHQAEVKWELAVNKKTRGANGLVVLTPTEEKLRTAILESGLPYSEIERRCGVSLSALSRFVKRERTLSASNFCTVLEKLGLDLVIVTQEGRYIPIQAKRELAARPPGRLTQDEEAQVGRIWSLANTPRYKLDKGKRAARGKGEIIQAFPKQNAKAGQDKLKKTS